MSQVEKKGPKGAKKGGIKTYKSKSSRAGLQFPVGRIQSRLKAGRYASRIGAGAPVYLAAVLVYLLILSSHIIQKTPILTAK